MLKLPLLGGKLERLAAALLLSVLLPFGFAQERAFAGGESAEQGAPPLSSGTPEKKAGEARKEPAAEAAKPAGEASKEIPADAKPADAKPVDAKPADSKAVGDAAAAGTKDANADAKPPESKPAGAGAKPADSETGSKPLAKPGEASAAPLMPAAAKDLKTATKPASATPGDAGAKPRDLSPKPDGAQSLAIRASTVNAVYNIHFLGAHIGDFKLHSSITNRQYQLQANADISVFFGAVNWKGVTSSYGLMTANGPVPQNYTFRYATSDRHEAVEIRFQQRMVQDIIINPPAHPGSRNVPITAADLQNVVDPLSAVILLSQSRLSRFGGADACNKRLPIFDGKVRYDLVLSPKGTRSIGGSGKLQGIAYVCRVNYVPIAGHKQGKAGDYATGNTGIEIWLVPMPEAGLLVPYYVHVPTPAGTASMVTAKFDVETPGGRHAFAD